MIANRVVAKRITALVLLILLTSCAVPTSEVSQPNNELLDSMPGSGAVRSGITLEQCRKEGGSVIGDIGDGRIHKVDFLCDSGDKPLGYIVYRANEPIPSEGAVCCV